MRDQGVKFPLFLLGMVLGVVLGFIWCSAQARGQSYSQNADGGLQFRQANQLDTGGYSWGSAGGRYDYGVPLYPPMLRPLVEPDELVGESSRRAIERARAGHRQNCREIVEINKFIAALGGEPTSMKGVCD